MRFSITMIVTMKNSVAIECGEGEQYFCTQDAVLLNIVPQLPQPTEQLGSESKPSPMCSVPAPNKCRRGLQRGICAESFLRRVSVFFPPIPWKRSTRNRHRQLKGSLHNRDPPKRFQGQAYKVQPTDWWMTEPGLLRLDWHPCNLPTSKSQCEAGKPWTGWNGHPWHLQWFHAAQFKSWRKMFAYSFVHPPPWLRRVREVRQPQPQWLLETTLLGMRCLNLLNGDR